MSTAATRTHTAALAFLLALAWPGSAFAQVCTEYRDDDGTRESEATIDFDDDFMQKTIQLTAADPAAAATARIRLYGQPYNMPGFSFIAREDYYIEVNGNPAQRIPFDPGLLFNYDTTSYQWVGLDLPTAWLVCGDNTFYIAEDRYPNGWESNNLRVGVDTDTDLERSWWHGNGVFSCFNDPTGCAGELMLYVELCPDCEVARDDDGTRESEATIDFDDDFMEKTLFVANDPLAATSATLRVYGQPYNLPGFNFIAREDHYIEVNGNPSQRITFDPGLTFTYDTQNYGWVEFDVPLGWLSLGANSFYFAEDRYPNGWETNNLRIGVDTDNDLDRSWWHGNGVFTCFNNPTGCAGELMVYLEVCNEQGCVTDADGDGVADGADNCPNDANAGQLDTDGDGQGDVCDPCPNDSANDIDGDGICADVDNCPFVSNPGQSDQDSDGVGDDCDNCVDVYNPGQENADADGSGDACDCDPTPPTPPSSVTVMPGGATVDFTWTGGQAVFEVFRSTGPTGVADPLNSQGTTSARQWTDSQSPSVGTVYYYQILGSCPWSCAEICDGLDNDCDGVADNGFNLNDDPQNCGACGVTCEPTAWVATTGCSGGACEVASCLPGCSDDDGDFANGCEICQSGELDLSINGFSFIPSFVVNGQTWSISAEVQSLHDMDLTNVEVQFQDESNGNYLNLGTATIPVVPARGTAVATVNYPNAPAGLHTIRAVVDPSDQVTETNEFNNQRTFEERVWPNGPTTNFPDFAIDSLDLSFNPPQPGLGSMVTISALIREGPGSFPNGVWVLDFEFLYESAGQLTSLGVVQQAMTLTQGIPGADTMLVSFNWTNVPVGTHPIYIRIDPAQQVAEIDEMNNEASSLLIVSSLDAAPTVMPAAGMAPMKVDFVANATGGVPPYTYVWDFDDGFPISRAAATPHVYSLFFNSSPNLYDASVTVTDAAGFTVKKFVSVNVQPNPNFAGPQDLRVHIDSVTAPPTAGQVDFEVRVANYGTLPLAPRVIVTIDLEVVWDGIFPVGAGVGGLPANQTQFIRAFGVPAGNHNVQVTVNEFLSIQEIDPGNNVAGTTFTIVNGPPLPPIEISEFDIVVNPARPVAGQPATIDVTVTNNTPQDRVLQLHLTWASLTDSDTGVIVVSTLGRTAAANGGQVTFPNVWPSVPPKGAVQVRAFVYVDAASLDTSAYRTVQIDLADLEVVGTPDGSGGQYGTFDISQTTNDLPIVVSAQIRNNGYRDEIAEAVFKLDSTEIGRNEIIVPAQGTISTSQIIQNPVASTTPQVVRVELDFTNSSVAYDAVAGNDSAHLPITISEGPKSYEVHSYELTSTNVSWGSPITATLQVTNSGQTNRVFNTRLFRRKLLLIGKEDLQAQQVSIDAGATATVTFTYTPGDIIGRWALGVEFEEQEVEVIVEIDPTVSADVQFEVFSIERDTTDDGLAQYSATTADGKRLRMFAMANLNGQVEMSGYAYKMITAPWHPFQETFTVDIMVDGGLVGLINTSDFASYLQYFAQVKTVVIEADQHCSGDIPPELWAVGAADFNGNWKARADSIDLLELGFKIVTQIVGMATGTSAVLGLTNYGMDLLLMGYDTLTVDRWIAAEGLLRLEDVALRRGETYKVCIGLEAMVEARGVGYVYIDFYHRAPHHGDDNGSALPIRGVWINEVGFEWDPVWWGP